MTAEAIIFLHSGSANYLARVLRQVRAANPDKPIFFLGDSVSSGLVRDYAECFDVANYAAGAARFLEAYVHLSHNPVKFTRDNIARWFILREFCRSLGIATFFHADSDVLLFGSIDSIAARLERAFGHFDIALSLPSGPYSTCGHASCGSISIGSPNSAPW
jgi:hypothetical protein